MTFNPESSAETPEDEKMVYTDSSTFLKGTQSSNPHNDYCQHFVDTGQRPQNFIRDVGLGDRFEEYPKLKELIRLKDELIAQTATPPMYLKCDLASYNLKDLGTKFDVILIEPPLEEYQRSLGVTNVDFWSWEKVVLFFCYYCLLLILLLLVLVLLWLLLLLLLHLVQLQQQQLLVLLVLSQLLRFCSYYNCYCCYYFYYDCVTSTTTSATTTTISISATATITTNVTSITSTTTTNTNTSTTTLTTTPTTTSTTTPTTTSTTIAISTTIIYCYYYHYCYYYYQDYYYYYYHYYYNPPLAPLTLFTFPDHATGLDRSGSTPQFRVPVVRFKRRAGLRSQLLATLGFPQMRRHLLDQNQRFKPSRPLQKPRDQSRVPEDKDGDFIHANVDIDLIITEEPDYGSIEKPSEIFNIIEHFCLGKRRLHLFGRDSTIRPGWLTLGPELTNSNFNKDVYSSHFTNGTLTTGCSERIESLRPKSPPPKGNKTQNSAANRGARNFARGNARTWK
nr:EOG090X07CF [Eulimnadia texana]